MKNIILIGMPASGKSTVGVVLAKTLASYFIDTDLIIQVQQRNTLQQLLENDGIDAFLHYEEAAMLSVIERENIVVATGGSAIFCEFAMQHLKKNGICVYLDAPLKLLQRRLSNIKTRGVAAKNGETIADIYAERLPYYQKYADFSVDCNNKTVEEIVEIIVNEVNC